MAKGSINKKIDSAGKKNVKGNKEKKENSQTTKFILLAFLVVVCSIAIYSLTSTKTLNDIQNATFSETNNYNTTNTNKITPKNTNTNSTKTTTTTTNSTIEEEEENNEEYEEYKVPSLKETFQINNILFNQTVDILKDVYKVKNATELDNIINSVGMLFHQLEQQSLSNHIRQKVNNPKLNRDLTHPYMGLYRDEFYCIKNNLYLFAHEDEIYNNITLFSDWSDQYTRDKIFSNFSQVASPMYGWELPEAYLKKESFALEYNVSQYYFNRPKFLNAFQMGKQFGCLFQGINKIPSSGVFTRKEGLARTYRNFMKQVQAVNNNSTDSKKYSEKCMKEFEFLPSTFNLSKEDECKEFFNFVISEEYSRKTKEEGFQFISKLGANVHQGQGINVLTEELMDILLKKYENGSKCGEIKEENPELVQGYLNDPLLLNGIKFEIRMHFVVASVNPLIIYAQDKSGVAFCALKYDAFDSQIQRHLCVYSIARKLLSLSDEELFKISGKTREQFMGSFSYQHTLESLQVALEQEGSAPSGWISNSFVPAVFRNFIHTLLMSRDSLQADQRFYEMYAPDIIINKRNMQPYILEYNTNPRMVNTSSFVHEWNLSTIKDIVLINMAQVRSRYSRVKLIVDEYIHQLIDKKNPNEQDFMKRLLEANKNKVESQFNVEDKLSSYVKIYDETDPKELYYKGNLIFNKECHH